MLDYPPARRQLSSPVGPLDLPRPLGAAFCDAAALTVIAPSRGSSMSLFLVKIGC